jgi:hypothetical protein
MPGVVKLGEFVGAEVKAAPMPEMTELPKFLILSSIPILLIPFSGR